MISGTGSKSRSGFTIIEILLVLFLIVGISSLFIANIDLVFRQEEEVGVENAFWQAVREGRLQSQLSRRPVSLFFDPEESAFVLTGAAGVVGTFPAARETRDGRPIAIEFVQERPRSELVLVRGQLLDTRPIEQVVFFPDGTSTQFWVELSVGSDRRQIRVDPWTGAEMLVSDR